MKNPKCPKYPKVKEYADCFLVDNKEIPYVLSDEHGNTKTRAVGDGNCVEVTVSFLAQSYSLDPTKRIHRNCYQFKKEPFYKRLFSKLRYIIKRTQM